MISCISKLYNPFGLPIPVRFPQQGSHGRNASNRSVRGPRLSRSLREDVPIQRCRFSLLKCITKAMKAISNFFRSIFNRFRSDLEPTLSDAEVDPSSRDPGIMIDVGRRLPIINETAVLMRDQALINGLVAQGVPPSMAEEVKKGYEHIRDTTFTAYNGQQFQIEKDDGFYFIKRTM